MGWFWYLLILAVIMYVALRRIKYMAFCVMGPDREFVMKLEKQEQAVMDDKQED